MEFFEGGCLLDSELALEEKVGHGRAQARDAIVEIDFETGENTLGKPFACGLIYCS